MSESSAVPTPFSRFVDRGLKVRLVIYFILAVAVIFLTIYQIVLDHVFGLLPFMTMCLGIGLGMLISRIYKISWQAERGRVRKLIGEMDVLGAVLLLAYVLIDVYHEQLVSQFVRGPLLASSSLAFLAGIMYGRVLGMSRKIEHLFKKKG